MRYLWQNKPFSDDIFKDILGSLYTEDGWITETVEHHGNFIQQTKNQTKFLKTDNNLFIWTGYVLRKDFENFLLSLENLSIDDLHTKLQNIDGDFSLVVINKSQITMLTNFFMRRPIFFYCDEENFCVSDVPGAIQKLHGNFWLLPRNSIWTIDIKTQNKIKSSPSYILNAISTSEQEFVNLYKASIQKVFDHGYKPEGLGLSEGVDSGCIDCFLANSDQKYDLKAVTTSIGLNSKRVKKMVSERVKYRQLIKRQIPHKVFHFNELDYTEVLKIIWRYIGRLGPSTEDLDKDMISAANLSKYFVDQNISQIFQGIGGTGHQFAVNWLSYYPSHLGTEKNEPNASAKLFPKDMSIIFHENMPALDWCLWENYTTDTVPYTIFGIEPYAPYYNMDLFCGFLGLTQSMKNEKHRFDTNQQANWPAVSIMNEYNYPYLTDGSNTCGPTFKTLD